MKRITKKAIKEAPKYMLFIDWKTEHRPTYKAFDYILMNSKNLIEAMNEAEAHIDETVYLVKVLEKTEEVDELGIIYSAVLANRKNGWHTNDLDHSEGKFEAAYNPNWSFDPCTFHSAS